ncbi:isopentenyl-diphosphate Delta-isomerase [Streptomyces sp. NRRL F-5123]|uniref:isopentenyl-diphosphate Delta-isomerase n=1 Tax=Streptomyces sp. NRRL F-5123 TaxID=1463856 RepID=UPI001F1B8446|nr:isopentenyl-diphosphate Delta-isomerase [Streptomyces sp. NRRL F-5123]
MDDPSFGQAMTGDAEHVVLLDESWNAVGSIPKVRAHHRSTPLHLAFTAYVFDEAGRLLLTRRALSKRTWPGVWTNSLCGHPAPGESLVDAVRRRLRAELGTTAERIEPVLGAVRYRATMGNGIVENEVGPAVRVLQAAPLAPNPDEVDRVRWAPWEAVLAEVDHQRLELSPWSAITIERLRRLGPHPREWPVVGVRDLPPPLRCRD